MHIDAELQAFHPIGPVKRSVAALICRWRWRYWRGVALRRRQAVMAARGGASVLGTAHMRQIKEYAAERFGSRQFWPWLAYYAEVRGEYVPGWVPLDYYRTTVEPGLNPPTLAPSTHKTLDWRLLRSRVLKPVCLLQRGHWADADGRRIDVTDVEERVRAAGEVVVKASGSSGGRKVRFCNWDSLLQTVSLLPDDCVVQPVVDQHPVLASIHPSSVNTVRLMTYLDGSAGSARNIGAVLRVGRYGRRVDNSGSGGLFAPLSASGRALKGFWDVDGIFQGPRHPDSGADLTEATVPGFAALVRACVDAHHGFPYVGVIGWDVAVNKAGDPVILEWNTQNLRWAPFEALVGPMLPDWGRPG